MWIEESTLNLLLISSYLTLGIAIFFTLYVWYKQKFSRIYLWFLSSFVAVIISLVIWTTWLIEPIILEPELASAEVSNKVITATLIWIFSVLLLLIGISKKK